MTKKRLGSNPLENMIRDTREERKKDKPIKRKKDIKIERYKKGITIRRPNAMRAEKEQMIREAIAEGETKNYYLNKKDEVMTRILIHLPFELAEKLREEAFNSVPRTSLSAVIRDKLKS